MIILDTHTLVWWVTVPAKLSRNAQKIIEASNKQSFSTNKNKEQILVSSISIWEICLLVKSKGLKFSVDINTWISRVEKLPNIQFIPVDNSIFAKSVMLPEPFHKDPADRIIVTTAREYGAKLVTSDKRILNYPHVQSVW